MPTKKTYPCYRCSGEGVIHAFGHVLGGVCFHCGGSGVQKNKPSMTRKWVVLDSDGNHVYNVTGRTAGEALRSGLKTFARAEEMSETRPGSAEFVASHNMSSPTAVPYSEYWTRDHLDRIEGRS
jgi:hypothetical protein